jgi:hypothetical protein
MRLEYVLEDRGRKRDSSQLLARTHMAHRAQDFMGPLARLATGNHDVALNTCSLPGICPWGAIEGSTWGRWQIPSLLQAERMFLFGVSAP